MKIALDNQVFSLQDRGGISRYFCELSSALVAAGDDVVITSILHRNLHLLECNAARNVGVGLPGQAGIIARSFAPLASFISDALIPYFKPDLVHLTYYRPARRKRRPHPTVVTVHDMIPEKYPDMTSRQDPAVQWKKEAILSADHVICVSHNTKRELQEAVALNDKKISVVHHGIRPFSTTALNRPHERPYLLYVGHRGGYKNFANLVKAVGARKILRDSFDVVAFGGPPFSEQERDEIKRAGISAARYSGDDAALAAFYRHAVAFIYPSLHEGFGLPPLEAMAQQCPVIASSESSIPEILEDAAMYFSPRDIEAAAEAIQTVVYDRQVSAALVDRGMKQFKKYTWERCAAETRAAYRAAIG